MANGIRIVGKVIGAERVVTRLSGEIPAAVRQNVAAEVRELGLTLERRVKLDKLEGQVLHRRSGRLVRSINTQFTESPNTFTASTGTRLIYGRAWELGFHGTVNVREHTRRVRSRDAYGRVATISARGTIGSRRGARIASGMTNVRAHQMKMNVSARPFLRPTLDEMRPMIRERILAAAQRSI